MLALELPAAKEIPPLTQDHPAMACEAQGPRIHLDRDALRQRPKNTRQANPNTRPLGKAHRHNRPEQGPSKAGQKEVSQGQGLTAF